MIMRSIFTQASVQLHFLCSFFHSVILFSFFVFFVLGFFTIAIVKHYKRISLRLHPCVTSYYIVLHPVSSRASRTSGLGVQFNHHSWLVDYRNI